MEKGPAGLGATVGYGDGDLLMEGGPVVREAKMLRSEAIALIRRGCIRLAVCVLSACKVNGCDRGAFVDYLVFTWNGLPGRIPPLQATFLFNDERSDVANTDG